MKEHLLLQVWMIFQDHTIVKDMLIYKAGFISFRDLCQKLHQVMDKVTLHIWKIYKKLKNSFVDFKIHRIMYIKILMKMESFLNMLDTHRYFQLHLAFYNKVLKLLPVQ